MVLLASSVSMLGDGIKFGALPLLAASLTRDPRLVSLVDVAAQSGWVLLGLVSGVLVDRWRRTQVMWIVDAMRFVVTAAFAVVVLLDMHTVALVVLAGLLLGLLAPFFDNASSAVLPELVNGPALERANGYYNASALLASSLIGPPVGAALFVVNAGLPLVIDALTFGLAAVLIAAVRHAVPAADRVERHGLRAELVEGLHYPWGQHVLRALAFLLLVVNLVGSGAVAILVLYVLDLLELPEAAFGWLVATYAVGGLAGAVIVPRISERVRVLVSVVAGGTLMGAGITVLGVWPALGPAVAGVVMAGFGSVWWNVTVSLRQRIVPRALLGRVTSVYRMIGLG
ncbi:MAG: MFS transporter, partial [Nocardioidaceae bacterium]